MMINRHSSNCSARSAFTLIELMVVIGLIMIVMSIGIPRLIYNNETPLGGTLSAVRSSDPDSANSQFFICFGSAPHLDRQYSAFGKVTKGMEFVDMIKKGDPSSGSVPDPDKIISLKSK